MRFSFIPRYSFRKFSDITPEFLATLGIRFLMLDLDNTIAMYSEHAPAAPVMQWVSEMKSNGIMLFFVSNSTRVGRIETFAEALGIGFIKGSRKPSPKGVLQAMEQSGFNGRESALLGDQIYTDTLAANRAGALSIIVRPLDLKRPQFRLRFAAETPFRAMCKGK
jgi:HAD superfamily phosphatase (TIGR01668 family)